MRWGLGRRFPLGLGFFPSSAVLSLILKHPGMSALRAAVLRVGVEEMSPHQRSSWEIFMANASMTSTIQDAAPSPAASAVAGGGKQKACVDGCGASE